MNYELFSLPPFIFHTYSCFLHKAVGQRIFAIDNIS